jgi:cytoplasmic iron level regulating protein YaaA (DUF328/UPF0246 family)
MESNETDLARTFKARGALLQRAVDANRNTVAGTGSYLPAWRRYCGVVWKHLDPASLTASQRRRILVPSALYGATTAMDDIGDYRLAMNASITGVGGLASYWREGLANTLSEHCRGSLVVNFLTTEFAGAIDTKLLASSAQIVHVNFVSADENRAVGHDAKAVKGFLARTILQHGLTAVDEFDWMGWRARRDGSDVVVTAPWIRQLGA